MDYYCDGCGAKLVAKGAQAVFSPETGKLVSQLVDAKCPNNRFFLGLSLNPFSGYHAEVWRGTYMSANVAARSGGMYLVS